MKVGAVMYKIKRLLAYPLNMCVYFIHKIGHAITFSINELPSIVAYEFKNNEMFNAWKQWKKERTPIIEVREKTIQEKVENKANENDFFEDMSLKKVLGSFKDLIDYKFYFVGDRNHCIWYHGNNMRDIANQKMIGSNHILVDDKLYVLKLITKLDFNFERTIYENKKIYNSKPEKVIMPPATMYSGDNWINSLGES